VTPTPAHLSLQIPRQLQASVLRMLRLALGAARTNVEDEAVRPHEKLLRNASRECQLTLTLTLTLTLALTLTEIG
jgi:hypothetical protein